MKENYMICNCKKVSYFDIADALHQKENFTDVLEAFEQRMAFARETDRPRLLRKTAEAYIYGICEQLDKAQVIYRKELRRKLRNGLKLGRECGCFPRNGATLWAYEKAYPVKPLWWLVSKLSRGGGEA